MKWILSLLVFALPPTCLANAPSSWAESRVQHYANYYRVPPELIAALIDVESGWNPRAVSNKGAMGMMQLMPATARRFGALQPFDAEQNIAAGTRYVTTLMWEFHGDLRLVAAAWRAQLSRREHSSPGCDLAGRVRRTSFRGTVQRRSGRAGILGSPQHSFK
jgi:soluble lytic murein transglycosylase-like protein